MWSISERSDRPGRAHEVQSYQLSWEQDRALNIHPVPDMYSVIRLRQPVQTMDRSHCLNRRVLDDSRLMLMRMSKPCWIVNYLNLKTISFMQTSGERVIMLLRSRTSPPATHPGDGTLNSAVSETVKGSLLMVLKARKWSKYQGICVWLDGGGWRWCGLPLGKLSVQTVCSQQDKQAAINYDKWANI